MFTEFNISFRLPSSDTCKSCDQLKIYNESAQTQNHDDKVNELPNERELHVPIADTMTQDLHTQRTAAMHNTLF
jgi:hypothetical protein